MSFIKYKFSLLGFRLQNYETNVNYAITTMIKQQKSIAVGCEHSCWFTFCFFYLSIYYMKLFM